MLLRLAYHDAASHSAADNAGGSNASIQFELDRPENFGLKRGWNVIQEVSEECDVRGDTPCEVALLGVVDGPSAALQCCNAAVLRCCSE